MLLSTVLHSKHLILLMQMIRFHLDKQFKIHGPRGSLEHEYAVTAWALSDLPEICVNDLSELTGEHCFMIERVVERLHVPPCSNDQVSGQDMTNIIDIFWREFKHWQNMTVCYAVCHGQFSTPDAHLA